MNGQESPFYGKFRGVVTDNRDPLMQGRIRAKVKDVFGTEESGWALPCTPYAGDGVGLYLMPPIDAWVWFEFEGGNPEYPIWSGCFWGKPTEVPVTPALAGKKVLKTDNCTITLSDLAGPLGGITIETAEGVKVILNNLSGVEITNGKGATVKLNLNQVSINNGALEVM